MHSRLLEAALLYAGKGWPVFPVKPRQKKPPLVEHGCLDAATDEKQIREWWAKWPTANVAIATGHTIFILDEDPRHGGDKSREALERQHSPLRAGITQTTGGGGLQHFFTMPDQQKVGCSTGIWPGIDIRGIGGYVLAPPSIHPDTGKAYFWNQPLDGSTLAPAPAWLLRELGQRPNGSGEPFHLPARLLKGQQHDTLFRMGCSMLAKGCAYDEIVAALWEVNQSRCEEPGPRENIEKLAHSICSQFSPKGGAPPAADADAAADADHDQAQRKQSTIITNLCKDVEFFHTQDFRAYAALLVNGHREICPVQSQSFRNFLISRFYAEFKKAPSADAIKETLALFCARAQYDGKNRDVGTRVLRAGGNIYIHLADEQWRAIEITKSHWRIVAEAPALFTKTRGMCPLPMPAADGDLRELKNLLHVNEEQWILIVAWLVAALSPEGPYPILVLHGEQGSAKSTVTRTLRQLVDPSIPLLRTVPRDERDLMITARNSWVITIDNLSGAQQWLSDALCRLSTGGGFGTRQLYSDDEEILFDGQRPIILNGIEDITKSPDLADRSVLLTLPPLPEEDRLTEKDYWEKFKQVQSGILGGLLNAVAAAHANIEHTRIPKPPRMADFATWVWAAAPALPFTAEEFLRVYRENRSESTLLALESSALASVVLRLIEENNQWEGTYTELLKKLKEKAPEAAPRSKAWPKNARALSGALRKFGPALRTAGCFIEELARDDVTKVKRILIQKRSPDSVKRAKPDPAEGSHPDPMAEEVI